MIFFLEVQKGRDSERMNEANTLFRDCGSRGEPTFLKH